MTDDLTPPHWGSQEMPNQQMTGDEINALVDRLETMGDVPISVILDAITTLRAQLAAETARADRAEAERAAQIDADAAICDDLHGSIWEYDAYECALAIRAQPHDRTALDAAIRAAKVEAWREAAYVDWSHGTDALDVAPEYLTPWQRGFVASQTAMRAAILALIGEATP